MKSKQAVEQETCLGSLSLRSLLTLLSWGLLFVATHPVVGQDLAVGPIHLSISDLRIDGETGPFSPGWTSRDLEDGVREFTLKLQSTQAAELPPMVVRWDVPSVDFYGYWNPNIGVDKVTYWGNRVTSRSSRNAPVISLYNAEDTNRFTFAISDASNKVGLTCYVREEDARVHCSAELFSERLPEVTQYEMRIRVDTRMVPYEDALADVSDWWANDLGYTPAPVPDDARQPMYSTWYSFHQNLNVEEILEELTIAKGLGYEAVIVDDGWQTLDSQRGYRYTGDWEPERIPDMAGFVDAVHELDMNFILWYSLPFMGEAAKNVERFRGKYLSYWDSQGTYVMDPRYPEVREYIIQTYEKAIDDWKLDGFKIDFIDRFLPTDTTSMTAENGRDYASVNDAVDRLMTDVMTRLRARKPDIMIEFRQRYIGPLMRKYGNMFRAVDCPNNAVVNRTQTTDLRLLSGTTAVHSDMFMWHPDEPTELAALQILNILFSVPQLSVRLSGATEEQLEMVRFWTTFWRTHREVLLDGKLNALRPGALYPILLSEKDGMAVVGVYEDMVVPLPSSAQEVRIVNATPLERLVIELKEPRGRVAVRVYDVLGVPVSAYETDLPAGVHEIKVPRSGLVTMSAR